MQHRDLAPRATLRCAAYAFPTQDIYMNTRSNFHERWQLPASCPGNRAYCRISARFILYWAGPGRFAGKRG